MCMYMSSLNGCKPAHSHLFCSINGNLVKSCKSEQEPCCKKVAKCECIPLPVGILAELCQLNLLEPLVEAI